MRNNTIIEPQTIKKHEEQVGSYCDAHLDTTLMDAVKNVLGFDKWVYADFSLIADDKAGGLFLNRPRRREATNGRYQRMKDQKLREDYWTLGQKPSGIKPDPKAAVSAMPAVSVKAKARIAAIFMLITPLQRWTMLQEQEKSCALSHSRDFGEKWKYSRPPRGSAQSQLNGTPAR
jgi:hypothetical protein